MFCAAAELTTTEPCLAGWVFDGVVVGSIGRLGSNWGEAPGAEL